MEHLVHMTLFQLGQRDVRDEPRFGASKAATNEDTMVLARHAVAADLHISLQKITVIRYLSHAQFNESSTKNSG